MGVKGYNRTQQAMALIYPPILLWSLKLHANQNLYNQPTS